MTIGTGGVDVVGELDQVDSQTLRKGMATQLTDDTNGGQWKGAVTSIGSVTADSSSVPQASVTIVPDAGSPIPLSEVGQNIRVTVTAATTNGPVLVVPVAAVFAKADGLSYVTVVTARHSEVVAVTVGLDEGGDLQVTVPTGTLHAGDQVVVGSSYPGPGPNHAAS
jgi:multidrug efflux pump subunit AcrA (membrane-fusion protein)